MDNQQGSRKILPEGNFFGNRKDDEFTVEINEEEVGTFKRFEYLSLPFSITNNEEIFRELLENAEENHSSFSEELERHEEAQEVVDKVYQQMENNPDFSKEAIDSLLAEVYVEDNIISEIPVEDEIEQEIAKFTAGWKHLADFYGIEGLVGGDGEEVNPFIDEEGGSMVAGGLDSLETILPKIREELEEEEWARTRLKISSIVGRDYEQIEHATDVLEHIHGIEEGKQDINDALDTIDELAHTDFTSNIDHGKFYNTLIRFHNWMPLNIKEDGPKGDQYDSICLHAKDAMSKIEGTSLHDSLSEIGDATSPKGLAMAFIMDEELEIDGEILGNHEDFDEAERYFQQVIEEQTSKKRDDFAKFSFQDPVMYPGLTGGKWKGLKLLHDAKEEFDMSYEIPEGQVVSSLTIDRILEDVGAKDIISQNMFSLDESSRQEIVDRIESTDISEYIELEDETIMRSSMYGEDGSSNFAGTYESFLADGDPEEAFKQVLISYFSPQAVEAREDKGMTHDGAISVIEQNAVTPERGGVVHLTEGGYSISEAENAEKAVEGGGNSHNAETIAELVDGTALRDLEEDLEELHETFGDIDLEYVSDREQTYLTQMRPKYQLAEEHRADFDSYERLTLDRVDEIYNINIENGEEYIIEMDFLGRKNMMDRVDDLNQFIRENQENIAGIEGNMPRVAHIPNNIESHFKIPYRNRGS